MRLINLLCMLLMTSALFTCNPTPRNSAVAGDPEFVSDPDHIYFKNLRTRDYQQKRVEEGVDRYLHSDLVDSRAHLQPYLLDRWIDDRAELRLAIRTTQNDEAHEVPFELELTPTDGQMELLEIAGPLNLERVLLLRQALNGKQPIYLNADGERVTAFPNGVGKSDAKEVIKDYLRLVGYP